MYVPYDRYGGVRGRGGEGRGEEKERARRGNEGTKVWVSYFLIFDSFFSFLFLDITFFLLSVTSIMSSSPRFGVASFVHSSGT